MEGIEHKTVTVNGIKMHVAEIGQGPVVLFLHGFPECWFSWRHQLAFMASNGYRAVAPDLRGYSDTTGAPVNDYTKFTTLHVVGDVLALLNAVAAHEEKVFVVGHDWGAMIAWALCLYRPDRVKALVNLSVAFTPRNPNKKPIESLQAVYGDDYYICRFQEPGEIEGEFAQIGTKRVLKNFLTYRNPGPLYLPKGKGFGDSADTPIILPSWLSEEEIDYYASNYEKSGFTGALNYYRALDINWELTAPWTGDQIKIPVKFIVGDLDLTYNAPGAKDFIHKGGFKKYVPLLKEVVVMEGVAHFIHQEKPDEINKHILDFFQDFPSPLSSIM
ncbi:alpha/beta-Hydrolases superfamily protein [Abeliophyllum distichum]|uniref:soluble epoxide hydrolase n=1 Tax=Abeliophyllum distichum TaxID=126358 RepID=A0ABD1Q5E0_9LAMI